MVATIYMRHRQSHRTTPEAFNLAEQARARRALHHDTSKFRDIVKFGCFALIAILRRRNIVVATVRS
jgi:hypothetical protein